MKKYLSLLPLLLLIFLLTACGSGSSSEPTNGDATVYVAVPLSGFQANSGQTVLGGVRLAAEQINRSGGLLGYKVVVKALDDESDSDVAVSHVDTVSDAINSGQHVLGIIGHFNSGQTLAAMEFYQNMDITVITPTASERSLTNRGFTNFFRVNANDDIQSVVDAEFLVENLGAKRVAVLYNDTVYAQGLAKSLMEELSARGSETVLSIEVKEEQSRFPDEVAQIADANPDAIFYAGYEIEAPYLRAEIVEAGIDVPMLASDGAFLAATIDEANGTAEGMYVSGFAPSPASIASAEWFEAYQAVEYRDPDTFSVNGYIAMEVLAEGIRNAGSLSSNSITDALRSGSFETIVDIVTYQDNGDLEEPKIWIYQVQNGEFVQVK